MKTDSLEYLAAQDQLEKATRAYWSGLEALPALVGAHLGAKTPSQRRLALAALERAMDEHRRDCAAYADARMMLGILDRRAA